MWWPCVSFGCVIKRPQGVCVCSSPRGEWNVVQFPPKTNRTKVFVQREVFSLLTSPAGAPRSRMGARIRTKTATHHRVVLLAPSLASGGKICVPFRRMSIELSLWGRRERIQRSNIIGRTDLIAETFLRLATGGWCLPRYRRWAKFSESSCCCPSSWSPQHSSSSRHPYTARCTCDSYS